MPKSDKATLPPGESVNLPNGTSPLDYMLAVMLDAKADPLRRDRMAMAAAPFVHLRATDNKPSEKEERAQRTKVASAGKFAAAPAPLKLVNGR